MNQEKKNVLLALDIDQTLAGGVVQAHLRTYNRELGLGMSEQEIMQANVQYRKTFDVPQIIEYRIKNEDRFQSVRKELLTSKQVNMDLLPIDGSVEAIQLLLSTYAHVGYYTVRPSNMLDVTKTWLANHRFPNAQATHITRDHADKIQTVNVDGTSKDVQPVLIDDSFKDLLEVALFQNILNDLKLVGFGISPNEVKNLSNLTNKNIRSQLYGLSDWSLKSVENMKKFIST